MSAGVILFVAFAACLVIGVPVSISLGVASLCSVVFGGLSASSTVIAQRIFGGLQSTSIMAIAFFVLAGNLMTNLNIILSRCKEIYFAHLPESNTNNFSHLFLISNPAKY